MPFIANQTDPNEPPRPQIRGGAGSNIRAGFLDDLDQNSDLHGDKWYGTPTQVGIAEKMIRSDAHVRKSIEYVSGPLRAAHWSFEPAGSTDLDREVADFCRWAFFENINWDLALQHILKFKVYGFSLLEMTDDVKGIPATRFPNHPGGDQGVVITGLHHRPSWTLYQWHQSSQNPENIDAITQWIIGSDGEKAGFRRVPASRLIRFTDHQDGANFAGIASLRSAYGPWKMKLAFQIIESIRHEKCGVGVPTIRLPDGAVDEDIDAAQSILAELRAHSKGYLILPSGYDFTWETISSGDGTAINESIERCNRDIAVNVGAGFMLLGLTGKTGSFALATSQQGQFEIGLEGDARFIADVFNSGADGWSPIERIVRMNYGSDVRLPRMVVHQLPTRDWSKILPVVHNLTMSGVLTADDVTEGFVRQVLRMPPRDPTTARQAMNGADPEDMETEDEGEE